MEIIKWTNRIISFVIEIVMLVILAYAGYKIGDTQIAKYALAVGLPVGAGILWGIFAAPKSQRRLAQPVRMLFKIVLFIICSALLYRAGDTSDAIVFGVAAILNELIAFFLGD